MMNRRSFIGLAVGTAAAAATRKLLPAPKVESVPGESVFWCGSGEMGTLYWSKPSDVPQYVWRMYYLTTGEIYETGDHGIKKLSVDVPSNEEYVDSIS